MLTTLLVIGGVAIVLWLLYLTFWLQQVGRRARGNNG
jgi:hypothetical protein